VQVREFRGFEVVEKFLELSDRQDFLTYLNRWYKGKKQEELKEMVHEGGQVKTNVTASLIIQAKNAAAFARQDREYLDEYLLFLIIDCTH
jgi:hypothetical protein